MPGYLTHSKGLASRRIGEEEVIVSPRDGKVWSLNPAGALMWELADGSLRQEELAEILARSRGVDLRTAAAELAGFAEIMIDMGLLERREAPGERSSRSKRAAEVLPATLCEGPGTLSEEKLQVLAGACDSNHSGQGAACMTLGSCASVFT